MVNPLDNALVAGNSEDAIKTMVTPAAGPYDIICKRCRKVGKPRLVTPGNSRKEIVLWICLILPGFVYSMWRSLGKFGVCAACNSDDIESAHTNFGKHLIYIYEMAKKRDS